MSKSAGTHNFVGVFPAGNYVPSELNNGDELVAAVCLRLINPPEDKHFCLASIAGEAEWASLQTIDPVAIFVPGSAENEFLICTYQQLCRRATVYKVSSNASGEVIVRRMVGILNNQPVFAQFPLPAAP